MALPAVACGPEDEVLVIDGQRLVAPAWTLDFEHALVAVCFIAPEAIPPPDGSPFRAAAVTSMAAVVDAFGAIHAVDAARGARLFSLPAIGTPVDVAGGSELVVATRERVWRSGAVTHVEASAVAVGAFATAQGVYAGDMTVMPSPGVVTDLVQRADGAWLAGTAAGLFGAGGKLLDGAVRRIATEGTTRIALQRSDTMIAVYDLPRTTPSVRVHYTDRTVVGIAFTGRGELLIGLDGGRTERVDLATGATTKTGPDTWRVVVQDERAGQYVTGRIGHRRGVIAIIPVASAVAYALWTYLHHPAPVTLPPRFAPLPKIALPACDARCESERLDAVLAACGDSAACIDAASRIEDAFGTRQCASTEAQLEELGARAEGVLRDAVASAKLGLVSACAMPAPPKFQLLGFIGTNAPRAIPAPANLTNVAAFALDESGNLYLATALRVPERCEILRRGAVDAQWTTILTLAGCGSLSLNAVTPENVTISTNTGAFHYDGRSWAPIAPLAAPMPAAPAPDLAAWEQRAHAPVEAVAANARASWVIIRVQ